MADQYFAAKTPEETASIILGKAKAWMNSLESSGYIEKLRQMWAAYHGAYYSDVSSGHQISFGGDQGELAMLPVNHLRNLGQHMLVMTCSNRPTMEARATNTDYKSLVQTYLANGLLDYYMREKRLESFLKTAVENAIVLGAGYIKMEWDATQGEPIEFNEETQSYIYEGDANFTNLSPFDVLFDATKESNIHDWITCRTWKNRFDLAAKYSEQSNKILDLPTKSDMESRFRLGMNEYETTDDISVYEFYHRRSDALPDGRYILFLTDDIILYDGPLPYRQIPVFRIAPSNILGTPFGYSSLFDVLPVQEGINALYSTILTNQNATGVSNFWVPRGADIVVQQLVGGLNIIEGNAGFEPKPLNLTSTPGEIFKFLEMLEKVAETLSGVNSVARGDPASSLKSGNALALVQSMALQFLSGLQQSYVELTENVGSALILMLRDFASTPRVAAIVGKHNRSLLKEFKGDDLSAINRVVVNVGNPLSKTTAGRVQMAEQMLQMGLITNPKDYFTVMNTGSLDSMTEDSQSELLCIKGENERIVQLQPVRAIATDDHKMHINEHKAILNDPDLRFDDKLNAAVLNHIQEHIDLLRNTDPDLLNITGQQPLPSPQQQGAPGAPPPGGDAGGPPDGGNPPKGGSVSATQAPLQGAPPKSVQGPGMPGSQNLPNLPKPPAPFKSNPVLAQDMLPQG